MALFPNDSTSESLPPPTAPVADLPTKGLPEKPTIPDEELRQHADTLIRHLAIVAPGTGSIDLETRLSRLTVRLNQRLAICREQTSGNTLTPQLELLESTRILKSVLTGTESAKDEFSQLPHVRLPSGEVLPQIIFLAEGYISAARIWSAESLAIYVQQFQRRDPLLMREIGLLPQALKLAQLEYILDRADEAFAAGELPPIEESPFSAPLHGLRRLDQCEWRLVLEPLIAFDAILREDPAGTFAKMEDETRSMYHLRVATLASHSNFSEVATAQAALNLARESTKAPHPDARLALRRAHIGYYLLAEGVPQLHNRIGYHPTPMERLRAMVRQSNEEFYILGTFTLSVLLITAIILPLVPHHDYWAVIGALLLALLPVTQGAVDLVNGSITALMKAEPLPKLDFSKGVPAEMTALVIVPTLLMNEKQVTELFEELEARYLANQDKNIHFGLLTDLPDTTTRPSDEDDSPLVMLALRFVDELNERYAGQDGGSFFLLHRHRVFNARQGVWMGWERKRGKLLDLNKLLVHALDTFPVKAGPLHLLDRVRYVITLDSDTQLPRGAAARLTGTIAHPLNQAIIDPRLRIVTAGYGILQPRVGVSVGSASRSRMAALYSGETGFDIYTRAVSDAYQDLFGEGIFTGKGIYEVSVLHALLENRFPRNALLSHDLIEGAYVRAGLATDIEVIDDYPSHYSAHTRRKHRWLRGDWQIMRWLFSRVPDESGRSVVNPISTISRWKIFDNLRRSLIEPVTFLLFLFGWFFLPGGPIYWTIATLIVLLLPGLVQFGFNLSRAVLNGSIVGVKESFSTFAASFGITILNLIFLAHHMLLSLDAIVRSLNRTLISGRNLLDWETAAQAEAGTSASSLDRYLNLSPVIALLIAGGLAWTHSHALLAAAPVLALWALAPVAVFWLDSPPRRVEGPLSVDDRSFLHYQALQIWRYFSEFGGKENHWLIPDNVEEHDTLQVRTLSPTNLGMLFNARQAAYEFGFITLPEFATLTSGTLETYDRLEKHRGHIYNWYSIESLQPIAPKVVSTVDSGNLAASFYTLHTGALDLLKRPLLNPTTFTTLDEMLHGGFGTSHRRQQEKHRQAGGGLEAIQELVRKVMEEQLPSSNTEGGAQGWVAEEALRRRHALTQFVEEYTPWLLPRFAPLFEYFGLTASENKTDLQNKLDKQVPTLQAATQYVAALERRIVDTPITHAEGSSLNTLAAELRSLLPQAQERLSQLHAEITNIAARAERCAEAMEFGFLLVESRQLLSIAYDDTTGEVHSACYDLLASEARIASLLAIAKGDIPQQSWFRLSRSHVIVNGRAALLSWTGTMFEYMMPALWMRTYPDTLIARSLQAAVRIQRDYVRDIPWGISESGFAETEASGRYRYQAWGIPSLALKYGAEDGPVISPYSTFLTLSLLRNDALANLRRMATLNWTGAYGFYEAADFTQGKQPRLVRSWMAHHQGMSLLAVANLLHENIVQQWFHANPCVRATQLLLHEKPLSKDMLNSLKK
ncbi:MULTISPECIES: glucoamylase family protein [Acidobacteriaceae]|uniref:glucoamylase family protein n=1 Tax=Acidobacteriaceae TaxID=204434 RepID=UPI00131AF100|nr:MULTISPECIES: glucoamylase family protein [Acidobacteriaceae]MDW5267648.1 glucoamylase family protein [Edaphobacter sp.]